MAMLEVACFSAKSATIACQAGADRIELCDDSQAGGTTPQRDCVVETAVVARRLGIPMHVMIRPRGGNFVYDELEYSKMRMDIWDLKAYADGFVFGMLTPDKVVDVVRTAELVSLARPLPCTFHRAFDYAVSLPRALSDVIETGCKAILTSGGAANASQGLSTLSKLMQLAAGRIDIIPGGGVRAHNLELLLHETGARCFHTSAMSRDADVPDEVEIKQMLAILGEIQSGDYTRSNPCNSSLELDTHERKDHHSVSAAGTPSISSPKKPGTRL